MIGIGGSSNGIGTAGKSVHHRLNAIKRCGISLSTQAAEFHLLCDALHAFALWRHVKSYDSLSDSIVFHVKTLKLPFQSIGRPLNLLVYIAFAASGLHFDS